jgi:biopolymer transport protein ExbB
MTNNVSKIAMRKGFLLKTVCLLVLLAAVLAVIVAAMDDRFAVRSPQTQTFFEQFVIAGGPIVWFVLLPMSLIMVFLAAEHSLTIRRKKLLPGDTAQTIVGAIRQSGRGQLETALAGRNDFVSIAVVRAVTQARGDWFRMRNLLFESLQEQALTLMRSIEWVNLIGNISPMVGLFGTVFGMIKLFNAIVTAGGQPQPAQLADGISVALVTTFWGLFIAIPALAIHWMFRNRIETLLSDATAQAENVMTEIRHDLKKQGHIETGHAEKTKQPIHEVPKKTPRTIDKSASLR